MKRWFVEPVLAGLMVATLLLRLGSIGKAQSGPESPDQGDISPIWSPTGDLIAFVSTREVKPEVYVMSADGSGQRRLTTSPPGMGSSMPAWSPDGRRIAFVTGPMGASQISVMNADGSDQRQLVSGGGNANPKWSPDGRTIAFLSNRTANNGVYVIRVDGGRPTAVTSELPSVTSFSWSPDGKRIAFATGKYQMERRLEGALFLVHITLESRIYAVDANGSNPRVLATFVGETNASWPYPAMDDLVALKAVSDPQLSPDGKQVAFVVSQGGSSQVFAMDLDGSGRRQLTFAGKNQSPVWSPDGRRIAFISDREGTWQVFIMSADGDKQTRLTASGECRQATWSPDGRRLAYSTKRGDLWQLYSVNADGTSETQLTTGQ